MSVVLSQIQVGSRRTPSQLPPSTRQPRSLTVYNIRNTYTCTGRRSHWSVFASSGETLPGTKFHLEPNIRRSADRLYQHVCFFRVGCILGSLPYFHWWQLSYETRPSDKFFPPQPTLGFLIWLVLFSPFVLRGYGCCCRRCRCCCSFCCFSKSGCVDLIRTMKWTVVTCTHYKITEMGTAGSFSFSFSLQSVVNCTLQRQIYLPVQETDIIITNDDENDIITTVAVTSTNITVLKFFAVI